MGRLSSTYSTFLKLKLYHFRSSSLSPKASSAAGTATCGMTVLKRYVLRLFISLKYITANVVDRNNGRIVATASTVEHSLKSTLECGRSCNAKAAAVVGEVLAMRLRVEGLEQGQGRGIHVDVNKEIEKKGFKKSRTKVWAVVNALKSNGIQLILEDEDNVAPDSSYRYRQGDDYMNSRG
ncbi:hypothetical protein Pfo_007273 [Paulownia fortunei]|nr:hypothetical protein Pfo_007273 [Paulownia fortunei]